MKSRYIHLSCSAIGMLILILDAKYACKAASSGIDLCIRTLIPALFPFLLLSSYLTASLSGQRFRILTPLERMLRIPSGSAGLFLIGITGGYPVGARCIRQAYDDKRINAGDACRMIAFCSNAGPSFLFGMVAPFFHDRRIPWILWAIHILAACTVAVTVSGDSRYSTYSGENSSITLSQAMEQAVRTMGLICGWVVFFKLILSFLDRWILWNLPVTLRTTLSGFAELSNGCIQLSAIDHEGIRFVAASAMLGFGGLCILMQTRSIWGNLPIYPYIRGKLLQALFSILYSLNYLRFFQPDQSLFSLTGILLADGLALTSLLITGIRRKNIVAFPA